MLHAETPAGGWTSRGKAVHALLVERLREVVARVRHDHCLTMRETDVLFFAAMGLHTKGIAGHLNCSPKTIEEYWQRILRRSQLQSRAEVVAEVLAEALLQSDALVSSGFSTRPLFR